MILKVLIYQTTYSKGLQAAPWHKKQNVMDRILSYVSPTNRSLENAVKINFTFKFDIRNLI